MSTRAPDGITTGIVSRFTDDGVTERCVLELNALLRQGASCCITYYTQEEVYALTDSGERLLYVAKDGRRIVGMALLRYRGEHGSRTATLEKVIVDHRYRRRGIGTAIVNILTSIARQGGARHLSLTSGSESMECDFYVKLGFSELPCGDPEHVCFTRVLRHT